MKPYTTLSDTSRRVFFRTAAGVTLCATAALNAKKISAEYLPIQRTGESHLRVSLNAYSFLELLNANLKDASKGIDLFGVCDFCAQHGFDAVDLSGYFFPGYPSPPEDSYIIKLKRYAFDRGLDISGTGVRNDFTTSEKSVREEGIQRIKIWIEVAAKLGAPVIRAFADSQSPFKTWQEASGNATRDGVQNWMADALRECAKHGEKFGVVVAVQNHGDFINTGDEHLSLLRHVDHPWCAALVDTGKYLTANPYDDIAIMAPYAVNWQIKETINSSPMGTPTDMNRLVSIIRKSGYRGYLPIETLAMKRPEYDPFAEVPKVLAGLRKAIDQTSAVSSSLR